MHQPRTQVYIIDDEPSICRAYARLVKAGGMDSREFGSVEEFLSSDFVTGDACVVADVQLPGKSGFELPALLREAGRLLPVIFVSAMPLEGIEGLAAKNGGVAFFRKPVDGEILLAAIRSVARHAGIDAQ
jgi:FixJ family two-component response regulator